MCWMSGCLNGIWNGVQVYLWYYDIRDGERTGHISASFFQGRLIVLLIGNRAIVHLHRNRVIVYLHQNRVIVMADTTARFKTHVTPHRQ